MLGGTGGWSQELLSFPRLQVNTPYRMQLMLIFATDSTRTLLKVSRSPRNIQIVHSNQLVLHIRACSHFLS